MKRNHDTLTVCFAPRERFRTHVFYLSILVDKTLGSIASGTILFHTHLCFKWLRILDDPTGQTLLFSPNTTANTSSEGVAAEGGGGGNATKATTKDGMTFWSFIGARIILLILSIILQKGPNSIVKYMFRVERKRQRYIESGKPKPPKLIPGLPLRACKAFKWIPWFVFVLCAAMYTFTILVLTSRGYLESNKADFETKKPCGCRGIRGKGADPNVELEWLVVVATVILFRTFVYQPVKIFVATFLYLRMQGEKDFCVKSLAPCCTRREDYSDSDDDDDDRDDRDADDGKGGGGTYATDIEMTGVQTTTVAAIGNKNTNTRNDGSGNNSPGDTSSKKGDIVNVGGKRGGAVARGQRVRRPLRRREASGLNKNARNFFFGREDEEVKPSSFENPMFAGRRAERRSSWIQRKLMRKKTVAKDIAEEGDTSGASKGKSTEGKGDDAHGRMIQRSAMRKKETVLNDNMAGVAEDENSDEGDRTLHAANLPLTSFGVMAGGIIGDMKGSGGGDTSTGSGNDSRREGSINEVTMDPVNPMYRISGGNAGEEERRREAGICSDGYGVFGSAADDEDTQFNNPMVKLREQKQQQQEREQREQQEMYGVYSRSADVAADAAATNTRYDNPMVQQREQQREQQTQQQERQREQEQEMYGVYANNAATSADSGDTRYDNPMLQQREQKQQQQELEQQQQQAMYGVYSSGKDGTSANGGDEAVEGYHSNPML